LSPDGPAASHGSGEGLGTGRLRRLRPASGAHRATVELGMTARKTGDTSTPGDSGWLVSSRSTGALARAGWDTRWRAGSDGVADRQQACGAAKMAAAGALANGQKWRKGGGVRSYSVEDQGGTQGTSQRGTERHQWRCREQRRYAPAARSEQGRQ
jgi:hypothetical protein